MIEIVFGESACGSLKIAQTYGKGKYRGTESCLSASPSQPLPQSCPAAP